MTSTKLIKKSIFIMRYIGNDPINIVWSEEPSEYHFNTIISAFNFAQIIAHPIGDVCRIQINKKKDNIKSIGPLTNYLTVQRITLPQLIGVTIVEASEELCYHGKAAIKHQYQEREETINAIRKEFRI